MVSACALAFYDTHRVQVGLQLALALEVLHFLVVQAPELLAQLFPLLFLVLQRALQPLPTNKFQEGRSRQTGKKKGRRCKNIQAERIISRGTKGAISEH